MTLALQYNRLLSIGVTLGTLFLFVWKFAELPDLGTDHFDKVSHLILFFVVGCCYINTATDGFKKIEFPRFMAGFIAALGYGALVEIAQFFIPWRSAELLDLAADGLGVCLALIYCLHIRKRLEPSRA